MCRQTIVNLGNALASTAKTLEALEDEMPRYTMLKTKNPQSGDLGLAYVRDGRTYLFGKPDDAGQMRCVVYSGTDYRQPDEGYPAIADAGFWAAPIIVW